MKTPTIEGIASDYTRCEICGQLVPHRHSCHCQAKRTADMRAIQRARNFRPLRLMEAIKQDEREADLTNDAPMPPAPAHSEFKLEWLHKPFVWLCAFGFLYFACATLWEAYQEYTMTPEQRFEMQAQAQQDARERANR